MTLVRSVRVELLAVDHGLRLLQPPEHDRLRVSLLAVDAVHHCGSVAVDMLHTVHAAHTVDAVHAVDSVHAVHRVHATDADMLHAVQRKRLQPLLHIYRQRHVARNPHRLLHVAHMLRTHRLLLDRCSVVLCRCRNTRDRLLLLLLLMLLLLHRDRRRRARCRRVRRMRRYNRGRQLHRRRRWTHPRRDARHGRDSDGDRLRYHRRRRRHDHAGRHRPVRHGWSNRRRLDTVGIRTTQRRNPDVIRRFGDRDSPCVRDADLGDGHGCRNLGLRLRIRRVFDGKGLVKVVCCQQVGSLADKSGAAQ